MSHRGIDRSPSAAWHGSTRSLRCAGPVLRLSLEVTSKAVSKLKPDEIELMRAYTQQQGAAKAFA